MAPGIYTSTQARHLSFPGLNAKESGNTSGDDEKTIQYVKESTRRLRDLQDMLAVCKAVSGNEPLLALVDPTLITNNFHALQFQTAASQQLSASVRSEAARQPLLIASPYNFHDQLLDLRRLDTQDRLFALALTILTTVRADYATAPYVDALNWDTVLTLLKGLVDAENIKWKEQSFYVVVFRSKLKDIVDRTLLHLLDQKSHVEATASGGLLKYWFGDPNTERKNLATCLWRSKEDARLGGLGPWHKQARSAARDFYDSITFSAHRFTVKDAISGWSLEPWDPKGSEISQSHAPPSAEPTCDRALV